MRHTLHRIVALGVALGTAGAVSAANDSALYARSSSPLYERPTQESMAPGSPIHSGGATAADTSLALDVAAALAADPRITGATITVTSSNGRVGLNGSVQSSEQAAHAEQTARRVAGAGAVSGTLSSQGG